MKTAESDRRALQRFSGRREERARQQLRSLLVARAARDNVDLTKDSGNEVWQRYIEALQAEGGLNRALRRALGDRSYTSKLAAKSATIKTRIRIA